MVYKNLSGLDNEGNVWHASNEDIFKIRYLKAVQQILVTGTTVSTIRRAVADGATIDGIFSRSVAARVNNNNNNNNHDRWTCQTSSR